MTLENCPYQSPSLRIIPSKDESEEKTTRWLQIAGGTWTVRREWGSLRRVARSADSQFTATRSSWGRLLEKRWTKSDRAQRKQDLKCVVNSYTSAADYMKHTTFLFYKDQKFYYGCKHLQTLRMHSECLLTQ